jgi:hypothetical protein
MTLQASTGCSLPQWFFCNTAVSVAVEESVFWKQEENQVSGCVAADVMRAGGWDPLVGSYWYYPLSLALAHADLMVHHASSRANLALVTYSLEYLGQSSFCILGYLVQLLRNLPLITFLSLPFQSLGPPLHDLIKLLADWEMVFRASCSSTACKQPDSTQLAP